MPGFHAGHPPRNKGLRYPADPPTVEEIVAVMRIAGDGLHGRPAALLRAEPKPAAGHHQGPHRAVSHAPKS